MINLLQFAIKFLAALFEKYGFIITGSNNSGNRFSGASILIASSEMEILLAIERDEITAHFRSLFDTRKNKWYSAEIVLALRGYKNRPGVLDDCTGSLIKDEIPFIISLFRKSEAKQTLNRLDEIQKKKETQITAIL